MKVGGRRGGGGLAEALESVEFWSRWFAAGGMEVNFGYPEMGLVVIDGW